MTAAAHPQPLASAPTLAATPRPPVTAAPWHSEQLLQGRKTVEIRHNGAIYHLQLTRQGKLILTK